MISFRKHTRRSIRLYDYDYSREGAYFITICTWRRECTLGRIINNQTALNEFGRIVRLEWFRSGSIRRGIGLDAFVVMPNHVHGIVIIRDTEIALPKATGRSPLHSGGTNVNNGVLGGSQPHEILHGAHKSTRPTGPFKKSLASFVAGYKSAVTKRVNEMRDCPGAPFWQRNYYEHVIRNEESLNAYRRYIEDNPMRWQLDEENLERGWH